MCASCELNRTSKTLPVSGTYGDNVEPLGTTNSNYKSFRHFTIPTLFIPDGVSKYKQKQIDSSRDLKLWP